MVEAQAYPAGKEYQDTERGPIFIGGLAYSGKTQLRLMLSAHPHLALSRRTAMWPRFYNRYGDLGRADNFERCLAAMLRQRDIQRLGPDPARIRREFRQGSPTYARLFALFQRHYAERLGKPRWGDQLGFIERYAEPIFAAYPDARMIHMVRDPRHRHQVSASRTRHRRGRLGWDTARWLCSAGLAERNRRRYAGRYLVVRYETLLAQPERTLPEICVFLGVDFTPAMLTMEDALRFGGKPGPKPASENGSPPLMSPRETAFTQIYAGQDMLALGYRLAPVTLSFRERWLFYAVDWPVNWAGMMAWRILKTRQCKKEVNR